jgi:dipeptidyl aminopeptidase/acylaminoacyl peptidase
MVARKYLIPLVASWLLMQPGPAASQPAPASAADEAARTVEAIAGIRSAFSPSFSPDGRRVAFVSNASGRPQIWVMSLDGDQLPVQLTDGADPAQPVYWSPTGDWLAYGVAPGGGLNTQIYVMRPDGSEARRLTAGGRDNNWLFGWTEDGRYILAGSNAANPAGVDALLLDPASGATRRVASGGLSQLVDVSRDGRLAVVNRLVSRGDNNLHLVDLATGAETLLTPHDGPGTFDWGEFSPDGRRIYVTSNAGRDLTAFGIVDLDADGRPGPIRVVAGRDDAEAEAGFLSRDGRRAALVWNAAGRSVIDLLDTVTGAISRGPELPFDVVGGGEFSPDGRRIMLSGTGAVRPTDLYTIELDTLEVVQRTRSAHEGVDLARLARPELVTYAAHDGLPLSGWLYRPAGASGPGPVVFNYHGGPEGQARPTMSDVTQALVARGISVFAPNVRGSSGFGKRFVNLDNGPLRVDGVRDIEATTRALVERGVADPARLGIMGGSYGGYMVMAGVTEYPDMFAAGANLFGVVNFATFFANTEPWMAAISTVEYGDPATQADMLRGLSPIHRLDRIRTPLIVLHGANDTNVPVVEAEQIVANLRGRDIPVEYILFPDEGHGWRQLPNRIRSTVAIVDFFDARLNRPLAGRPEPAAVGR